VVIAGSRRARNLVCKLDLDFGGNFVQQVWEGARGAMAFSARCRFSLSPGRRPRSLYGQSSTKEASPEERVATHKPQLLKVTSSAGQSECGQDSNTQFDHLLSKNQIDVSFHCVCPVTDNDFHHNIVKAVCGSTSTATWTM